MIIHSKVKDYDLKIVDNIFDRRNEVLKGLGSGRPFFFVDENVYKIYGAKIRTFIGKDPYEVIPATEHNKSYLKLGGYYRVLIKAGFKRSDIIVTIGGGILQDISGFIASTIYRGVGWIFIPTTLLAQADSCIGSKTSINFDDAKNLIGSFYPPDAIYIDYAFSSTLARRYFNSGVGEIIKFHLMADGKRYRLLNDFLASGDLAKSKLLKRIVASTLEIKRSYFEGDEFDTGRRNLLNYGHCFGHALESASGFAVSHGEAVIAGMGFANLISFKRRIMKKVLYDELDGILSHRYQEIDLSDIDVGMIIDYMKRDKKRTGKDITMILASGLGKQARFDDIGESEVRDAYGEFMTIWRHKR